MKKNKAIRLQHFLAQCGIGSRRRCEKYIESGRVLVNGDVIYRLGTKVTEDDQVVFDNKKVFIEQTQIYVALNKPKGYLSSSNDPQKRSLAIDLIKNDFEERLFHIGRLDYMSEGLLLFTNDGYFAEALIHPSYNIEKEYIVHTTTPVKEVDLLKYVKGVQIAGETFTLKQYKLLDKLKCSLILIEGKNREIRKVFSYFGYKIQRLQRIRIGIISLGPLKKGHYRKLTQEEIRWFLNK